MVPMTCDIGVRTSNGNGRLLAPKAGWTASALPSCAASVIQYRNHEGSRVIAVLGWDGIWMVLRININQIVHSLVWSARRLVEDLDGVTAVEIVSVPAKS
jgi:hypothetical protein